MRLNAFDLKEKNGIQWVEIKLSVIGAVDILIFVGDEGWYNPKRAEYSGDDNKPRTPHYSADTKKFNLRLSMNGAAFMTYDEWNTIDDLVEKAKKKLYDNSF